ncbi:chemotaxis protein CheX [Candidatus Gastranaerophilus sp. (ex Termes propinquus)]|nr:chemotaxis protein CheX [Candidatus Gastranaerophilus sp. (ex Termes propinquus)]
MSSKITGKFIDVFDEVLSYFDMDHQFMREVPESTLNTTSPYSVLVGVSGATEGNVMFGSGKKTVLEIAAKLMGINKIDNIDIYVQSAIADLYSDFCKRVLGSLAYEGNVFSSEPTYISGENMKVMISQTEAMNLFFRVNGERFQIAYSLVKSNG